MRRSLSMCTSSGSSSCGPSLDRLNAPPESSQPLKRYSMPVYPLSLVQSHTGRKVYG
ncbi:hypothetical protein K523DRAFT_326588 [Schizophyllum commune Tattone D]|nr:hypothetical protein K523DRAFT_326588 [Schizophyllum commune Tattone D]